MPKLNQIVAIEKGVKNQQNQVITETYHTIQKNPLFAGIAKSYAPKDEDGDKLPSEATAVQVRADELLANTAKAWTELLDVTMTKNDANTYAKADVEVDGKVLLKSVPVPSLLFLEKQLTDLHSLIKKLPTLDPSEKWGFDQNQSVWATPVSETTRTKKVPKVFEKAPATKEHPAQVEMIQEDVLVGTWKTIKFSGAMPATRVAELLARVEKLQRAVKFARETANTVDANPVSAGKSIFDFVLA